MKRFLILVFLGICVSLTAAPLITNISPDNGPSSGGTSVTITGSGFTGATSVTVDGVSTPFNPVNDTTITFTSAVHVPENVTVVVTTPSGSSPANHPNDFYTFTGDWTLYIPGLNTSSVYAYNVTPSGMPPLLSTISVGSAPKDVVVDPFGKYAYVVNNGSDSLSVINVATNTVIVSDLPLTGLGDPNAMAISPTQPKAYITDGATNGKFAVIDLTNPASPVLTTIGSINAGDNSVGVAFTPDGTFAYIGGATSGNLYRITSASNTVTGGAPLPAVGIPGWITMLPNQNFGIVTDNVNNLIRSFDLTNTTTTFPGSAASNGMDDETQIVVSRDSGFAYDLNTLTAATGSVNQFQLSSITSIIPGFIQGITNTEPRGIWLTPDAKTAFVTSTNSNIASRVDNLPGVPIVTPFTIPATATASEWPCITPDQAPVARFSFTTAPGNVAMFDGSGSVSPVGTIASYIWNFGDATPPVTTTSPTVSHTYASGGPFTVTLQVVNSAGTSIASSSTFTGQTFSNHGADFAATQLVVSFVPSAPTNGAISQTADKFLTQVCYENTITWSPPTIGSAPVSYIIFADAGLTQVLGTVPASGPLVFVVCSKTAHVTYYIVAVDATGAHSPPLVVSI